LIKYDLDDPKLWKPYFPPADKKHQEAGQPTKYASAVTSHVQDGAPNLKMMPPMAQKELSLIEKDVKEYLTRQFEDDRIKQVKKTTNWNMDLGRNLDELMKADQEQLGAWEGGAGDHLPVPAGGRRGRRGDFDGTEWFNEKYKQNDRKMANIKGLLRDFEAHALSVTNGGTCGKMRPDKDKGLDEDIRGSIV